MSNPAPLSRTKYTGRASRSATPTSMRATGWCCVNFQALRNKLSRAMRSRLGSPLTSRSAATWQAGTMLRVPGSEPLGHQHFDGLFEQLRAHVSEQAFGLRVHQNDLSRAVDNNHGVGRGFQQSAEFLLGL